MVEGRCVLAAGAVLQILGVVQVVWQVYDVGRKLTKIERPKKVELPRTATLEPGDDWPTILAHGAGRVSIQDIWKDHAATVEAVTQINAAIDQVDGLIRAVVGGKVWVHLLGPFAIALGIVLATWPDPIASWLSHIS
ncbi:MAG: hypothetical protein ACREQ5_38200 [Candidatus Dormibacteria bacterium]